MSTPAIESTMPLPRAASAGWFVTSIVLLSLGIAATLVPVLAAPFLVLAIVHLSLMRRRALQAHHAWTAQQSRNVFLESETQRLGVSDHVQRQDELKRLDQEVEKGRQFLEAEQSRIHKQLESDTKKADKATAAKEHEHRKLEAQINNQKRHVKELKDEVLELQDAYDVQDYGLYSFENPADDSVMLGESLRTVQGQIKAMVRDKSAATGSEKITMDNNLRKGQRMVADMVKLLLRAFNAEAENSVKTVKAGHLSTAKKRLRKSAEAVERLGKSMDIKITHKYLHIRERELEITHKHLEAVKAAKETEREVRRQEREEAKAQKEFLAAKAKQEKEVEHYRNVVATLIANGDEDEAAKVKLMLTDAEEKLEDVERTMANTRAGYVYVASNRGAFGEGVVKVGMTRRLNPDERIKELSDASVPFNFDKHTMIFSEDAVGLENDLHRHFSDRRVNLINMRREYFYATPAEVKEALIERRVQVLEYHEHPEAVEFEASQLQRKNIESDASL